MNQPNEDIKNKITMVSRAVTGLAFAEDSLKQKIQIFILK